MKNKQKQEREDFGGSRRDWTTEDECEWLDRLGCAKDRHIRPAYAGQTIRKTRRELLAMYVANIGHRFDWGAVDAAQALRHAQRLLVVEMVG